jgi:hypothetical protein
MNHRLYVAGFAKEEDLLRAVAAVRQRNWPVVEAYTPYPVHGLDQALGLPRSQLGKACFFFGLVGVTVALGFQFWASARDWPLNVGGQPWNSWPAFIPVTFECMVLFAALGLVLTWLLRSGLYPGKQPLIVAQGQTNDRFVLVVGEPTPAADGAEVRQLLQSHRAISLEEREGGQ